MKITIIGAGSREFGPATVRDLLLSDPICGHDGTGSRSRRSAGGRDGHRAGSLLLLGAGFPLATPVGVQADLR
jgi:hypothetical protein